MNFLPITELAIANALNKTPEIEYNLESLFDTPINIVKSYVPNNNGETAMQKIVKCKIPKIQGTDKIPEETNGKGSAYDGNTAVGTVHPDDRNSSKPSASLPTNTAKKYAGWNLPIEGGSDCNKGCTSGGFGDINSTDTNNSTLPTGLASKYMANGVNLPKPQEPGDGKGTPDITNV